MSSCTNYNLTDSLLFSPTSVTIWSNKSIFVNKYKLSPSVPLHKVAATYITSHFRGSWELSAFASHISRNSFVRSNKYRRAMTKVWSNVWTLLKRRIDLLNRFAQFIFYDFQVKHCFRFSQKLYEANHIKQMCQQTYSYSYLKL